jgi:hypothetical protein
LTWEHMDLPEFGMAPQYAHTTTTNEITYTIQSYVDWEHSRMDD